MSTNNKYKELEFQIYSITSDGEKKIGSGAIGGQIKSLDSSPPPTAGIAMPSGSTGRNVSLIDTA